MLTLKNDLTDSSSDARSDLHTVHCTGVYIVLHQHLMENISDIMGVQMS